MSEQAAPPQAERGTPGAPRRATWLWHLLFLLTGAAILFVLWLAPPARTPVLPRDKEPK